MISVSQGFRTALENGTRDWLISAEITLASGGNPIQVDNDKIWQGGFSLEDAVSADNQFDVGATIVNELQIRLNNMYGDFDGIDFDGAAVSVQIGLMVGNSAEYVNKGTFTVYKADYIAETINLVCYDGMMKFDRSIAASNLVYPATLRQIVSNACSICGPIMSSAAFPNESFSVPQKPEGDDITFRELISWAAQIAGCYARVNPSGSLELKWYDAENLDGLYDDPITATDGSYHLIDKLYSTPNVSMSDIEITQVSVIEDTVDSSGSDSTTKTTIGTDGYSIVFEKNGLIQNGAGVTVCQYLATRLIGFKFRKASASIVCDPTIEAGDIGLIHNTVKDETFPVIVSRTRFTLGKQDIISSAMDPQKTGIQRYSNSVKNYAGAMWAIVAEGRKRSDLTKLVADTITAYDAEFETLSTNIGNFNLLSANVIDTILLQAQDIQAAEADIGTLQTNSLTSDSIIVNDLQGHTATIAALAADYAALTNAAIGSFAAGGATIGNLIATNLNGANATINVLDATVATITTLLNGNQATQNLQAVVLTADKTTIDWAIIKNLLAQYVSALEFDAQTANAVKINTDYITIGDDDGAFVINGKTLQVSDDNGIVRIQMGRDANDNYTFTVFDSTGNGILIDATGIKEGAVANELIVDRMVKAIDNNYSGISGNKLNINSVVSRLNDDGTNTIKATKIYVDEENQNAALVFSDIRSDIGDNTTAITVANGKIDKLISTSEIEQIPSGETMFSQMHHIEETVDGYSETISSLETTINGSGSVTGLVSKIATVENNLNGFQNTVSHTYVTKTEASNPNLIREADLNSRCTTNKGIVYEYEGDGWWYIHGTVTGTSAGTVALYGVDSTGNLVTTDSDVCIRVETNVSPLTSGTDSQIQIRYAESSSASSMSSAYINADGGGVNVSTNSSDVMVLGSNDATLDQDGILHFDSMYVDSETDGPMTIQTYDDSVVLNRAHNTGCRIAAIRHYIGANATGQTINGRIRIKVENGDVASGWYPAAEDPRYLAETSHGTNLSPFFAYTPLTLDVNGDYWTKQPTTAAYTSGEYTFTYMGDGWIRVQCDNTSGASDVRRDPRPIKCDEVKPGTDYTFLMEFRNNNCVNTNNSSCSSYHVQNSNCQFWGNTCKKVLEGIGGNCTTSFATQFAPETPGTYIKRVLRTSEATGSTHWTLSDPTGLIAITFYTPAGCKLDVECRISIYEGEYLGDYVPYIDGSATSKIAKAKDEAIAAAQTVATETLNYGITANDGVIKQYVTNTFVDKTTYNTFANTTVPSTYATQQALNTLQTQVDAMEQSGTNLVVNTLVPDVTDASHYPKLKGQGVNTSGRGTASTAEHGIRFTLGAVSASGNYWPFIRFGTSVIADADMLGLTAGETYTLSFDLEAKLLSGSPSSSTEYLLETRIFDNHTTSSTFAQANGSDSDRIIHTYATADTTDRGSTVTERHEYTFTVRSNATKLYIDLARLSDNTNTINAQNDFIEVSNLKLEKGTTASEWTPAYEDLADTREYVAQVEAIVADLQDQVDGKVETWFGAVAPTASNAPASSWTTTDLKDVHVGDLYYDRVSGYAYEYTKTESGGSTTYAWTKIDNSSGIQTALTAAQGAQTTADNKITTFTSQPQTSDTYAEGDLWVNATYNDGTTVYDDDLLICIDGKNAGVAFDISDWQLATKYTDDSKANDALDAIDSIEDQLESVVTIENFSSQITQNRDSIVSTVQHDFLSQETFNSMSIGGRNLLLGTGEPKTITLTNASTNYSTGYYDESDYGKTITAGDTTNYYTVSYDWETTSSTGAAYARIEGTAVAGIIEASGHKANDKLRVDLSQGSGHYYGVFKITSAQAAKTQQRIQILVNGAAYSQTAGSTFTVKNLKFERGTKPTTWTPAPEDVAEDGYVKAKNYTDTTYGSTKSWVEQNSGSFTQVVQKVEAHDTEFDTLEALVNNSVTELIVGEQTSSTNAWTGTASFSSLTDGKTIIYWLPLDSTDNDVTLALTLSGGNTVTKNCYFKGNTRLRTQFTAGSQIRMVYRQAAVIGGNTYEGWWSESYADAESTDTYDRLQYKASVTAQTTISVGQLGVFNSSGYLIPLSTTAFDVTKPILYVGTAFGTGSAATQTNNYISMGAPFDLRTTKSGFSGTKGASVYIVGTLNGSLFTPDSAVFTCTQPNSADGKIYILLGFMSSKYFAVLAPEHPMYKYVGGAFKSLNQVAYEAQDDVDNLEIPGDNLILASSVPDASDYFYLANVVVSDGVFVMGTSSAIIPWLTFNTGHLKYGDYKNDTYTLSFEGKTVNDGSGRDADEINLYFGVKAEADLDAAYTSDNARWVYKQLDAPSTSWTQYSFTVSIPDDFTNGSTGKLLDNNCLAIRLSRFASSLPFHVRNVKLERGDTATPYTPAQEDSQIYTDTKLTAAKTEIKQTTDTIELSVTANANAIAGKMGYDVDGSVLVSRINLTPEAVTIDANKINLNGAITANDAFKVNKDGTIEAAKGGKISGFVFNSTEMKRHVLASSIQGLNILQNSDDLDLANNSVWSNGTYRKSGTGDILVSDPPSLPSGLPSSLMCAYITASTVNTQCGICQDGAILLDHEVTFSVYVKGSIGDRVDIQPFWNSSDSYRVSFTLETTDWVRLSCTAAPKKAYASISIGYVYLVPKTAGNILLVVAPKLEYGTAATAYALNQDYPAEQEVGNSVQIGEGVVVGANGIGTTEPGSTISDSIRSVLLNRGAAKFISGNYLEGYISSDVSNDNAVGKPGISIFYAHSTNHNATGTKIATFWENGIDLNKQTWLNAGLEITAKTPYVDFHCNNTSTDFSARIYQPSSGGNLIANPGISNSSDARLKKEIVEMDESYTSLLDKLRPKEYRFRKDDTDLYLGFIAQDVISAMEELGIEDMPIVSGTGEDDDYYALDYTQFIPVLVRKCQQQDDEIQKLKDEIEELKNMVKELVQK